jgi:uncharacterized protein YndB with AHSA1/START domain
MKKLLKVAAYVVAALALLIVVMLGIGAAVPEEHVASVSAVYAQPVDTVWAAISDYRAFPSWRSGVDTVEARTFDGGASGWLEDGATGPMPLAVEESQPPRRLVLRIASDALPFGGTWTYELAPEGDGTRLTITENGTISNLLFRFVARFVLGYTATMETYLIDLGGKFGEQTTPIIAGG